jgi:hypothetical protein
MSRSYNPFECPRGKKNVWISATKHLEKKHRMGITYERGNGVDGMQ